MKLEISLQIFAKHSNIRSVGAELSHGNGQTCWSKQSHFTILRTRLKIESHLYTSPQIP